MLRRLIRWFTRAALLLAATGFLAVALPRLLTALHAAPRLYTSVAEAPSRRVAVIFGAGLLRDGSPTPVLRDRVATGVELYLTGKVEKLLMSGDNRVAEYNEPEAMRQYAIDLGVPEDSIVLDYAGRSTYETCYRAKAIFQVVEPVLVTQSFHLPRAIYTCSQLGLQAVGVSADRRAYRSRSSLFWNLRELPATLNAFWQVHFTRPLPVLGDVEPIFPYEMQ